MEDHGEGTCEIYEDAPETPAPVFAFRAFKQALFGTPKPEETSKRQSRTQPRRVTRRPNTIALGRSSTSTQDDRAVKRPKGFDDITPRCSPRKPTGILVTPGTAGKNRKTVTFHAHQRTTAYPPSYDAQSGSTPKAVPGYFPSPAKQRSKESYGSAISERYERRASDPMTYSCLHASTERGSGKTDELEDRISPHGQYSASTHSQSELNMLKLVKREQIAKKFARAKEEEVLQLQNELEMERKKVQALEEKLREYAEKLKLTVDHSTVRDTAAHPKEQDRPERPRRKTSTAGRVSEKHTRTGIIRSEFSSSTIQPVENSIGSIGNESGSLAKAQDGGSSDIWADLNYGSLLQKPESEIVHRRSSNARKHKPMDSQAASTAQISITETQRKPLTLTSGNASGTAAAKPDMKESENPEQNEDKDANQISTEASDMLKSSIRDSNHGERTKRSQMSDERRAAAQKRIEERQRARVALSLKHS